MDDLWHRWRIRPRSRVDKVEVTAQARYAALVKDVLSPGFRAFGFKGSGGRYSLASDTCWALMSLQKSAYSDSAEVQFTINLLVANKAAWNAERRTRTYLPEHPAAGVMYGEPATSERIGILAAHPADKWWRLYAGVDEAELANDVLADVRELAVPWFAERVRSVE